MTRIVTVVSVCCFSFASEADQIVVRKDEASHTSEIESPVEQLDHRTFSLRQQAHRRLIAIGEPALLALQPARAHKSAEVRMRVRALIEEIRRETLYTVTHDGRLIRLKVGKRTFEQQMVAKLGSPFARTGHDVKGLAMSPAGMLYATAGRPRSLFRIDPNNGTTTKIGAMDSTVNSVTFGPKGLLYGVSSRSKDAQSTPLRQVVVINLHSGLATYANVNVDVPIIDAIAIDASGHAVFSDECHWLCRLSLRENRESVPLAENGSIRSILHPNGRIEAMCFAGDGTLFCLCNKEECFLVRLDPQTGNITTFRDLQLATRNLTADVVRWQRD